MTVVGPFGECVSIIDSIDVQRRLVDEAKSEMHELVIVTREVIAQSRAIMSEADRLIGRSAARRGP
jgi:hypothetical protein